MGILSYEINTTQNLEDIPLHLDERYKRDPATDLKEGIDLLFDLKNRIDKFHPVATDILVRLISQ